MRTNPLLTILMAYGLVSDPTEFKLPKDELEGIDIDKEMELIRQKKSNLSARRRRIVEYRYEQKHKEARQ